MSPGASPWMPLGRALEEFRSSGLPQQVDVRYEDGRLDSMSTADLERQDGFPEAESLALEWLRDLARASEPLFRVVDVGSGAGCHVLQLAREQIPCLSVEVDLRACVYQRQAHAGHVVCGRLASLANDSFDCALLMMNGLGLAGRLAELPVLLTDLQRILRPGGVVLVDGCDLRLTDSGAEQTLLLDRERRGVYFGEAWIQLRFGSWVGQPFPWLYVDAETLAAVAAQVGGYSQVLFEDVGGEYLARLVF